MTGARSERGARLDGPAPPESSAGRAGRPSADSARNRSRPPRRELAWSSPRSRLPPRRSPRGQDTPVRPRFLGCRAGEDRAQLDLVDVATRDDADHLAASPAAREPPREGKAAAPLGAEP